MPSGDGAESVVVGPGRPAHQVNQRTPLLVGAHGDGDPVVVARAAVEILDGPAMSAVAPAAQRDPEYLGFHRLNRGGVQYRFDHRQLDELAFSGALGEVQRGQHRERRVNTGQRIAGPLGGTGGPSGNPVTQASPAICSMVGAKPTRSRHGPSSPNAGIRAMTSRGLTASKASAVSPKWSITRGGEVLDHHVGVGD